MSLLVNKVVLDSLNIEDVAKVLNENLNEYFESVFVSCVDCPDLTNAPFNLAAAGLGGHTAIADVGGPPYLIPLVNRAKIYSFKQIAQLVNVGKNTFVLGASAGPFHVVGQNCELMPNVLLTKSESDFEVIQNNTHFAKVNSNDEYSLTKLQSSDFGLLGNFFISEGKPGKVIKIEVTKRVGQENFITTIRNILNKKYPNKNVSLGGVFLIEIGNAKLHIMPDFSTQPLLTDDDVNKWLRYFEMNSPLVCLTSFHSRDLGLDLRMEHTHCFSDHNQGGHYHYDTTPNDVKYVAYFNLAEAIYRIDQPIQTHQIGRD